MKSITLRPEFHGPDDYVEHVAACLSSGYEPFEPATIAELHAAIEQWPDYARRWLPTADECSKLGIDPAIGQMVEPLTDGEQDRLLLTLRDNDEFRVAVCSLILERGAA